MTFGRQRRIGHAIVRLPRGSVGAAAAGPPNRFGAVDLDEPHVLDLQHTDVDDGELEDGEAEAWPEGFEPEPASLDGGEAEQGRGDRAVISRPNTVRWGDKASITFDPTTGRSVKQSTQLLQVKLPRPMICSVRLTAIVRLSPGPTTRLDVTTLDLHVGVGSSQQKITRSWWLQPNGLQDLDVIISDIPVTQLLAEVSCIGTADGGQMVVTYNMALAPTVRT